MPDSYLTLEREQWHETEVNRSRFLCVTAPVATEAEALALLERLRAAHPTASHHCYAYVLGADADVQKASDDGEPSGTAGNPMLAMLLRRELRYVAAVVVRYFGGTKLGAGGLIRAYGGAVGETLDRARTLTHHRVRLVTVTVDHQRAGRLENDLRATGRSVLQVTYADRVAIQVGLPVGEIDAFEDWLANATSGQARWELGEERFGTR
ncbi:YigZ family protein [Streptomyces sp. NPDC005438]|uniref:YigZ family protein n=1 Tax=Streptomyces sp. NPDC005438 TaxID=3156880 RepID=UPI0033A95502